MCGQIVPKKNKKQKGKSTNDIRRRVPQTCRHRLHRHITKVEEPPLPHRRSTRISSARISPILRRKGSSQACSLMSLIPSSASAVVLMRRSFTFISSRWIPASFREMNRVNGIITSITATPLNVAHPSFPHRRISEPMIWNGPDQIVCR